MFNNLAKKAKKISHLSTKEIFKILDKNKKYLDKRKI